eukprot:CAMPEP_0115020092 /NCGR_PEP_ID=MMETSP0216-20121206/29882_1 /TAXON_ID=223996 /ORGANISM="Protocruzia adherens, Strain Boccale" /LENGTH=412 /DNA_ID=CAMNT_0002391785 /DNA_START=3119 /DNA_END=4357 /DNA_ORIENTATION=+
MKLKNKKAQNKGQTIAKSIIKENPFEKTKATTMKKKKVDMTNRKPLIEEYKSRSNANQFSDRRFGEKDHTIDEETRFLARFQRERALGKNKKMKFNLDSDEEITMTHFGKNIDELDDFGDNVDVSSDEEMDRQFTEEATKAHFGGDEKANDGDDFFKVKKTKKEVYEEIIAKSKMYKAEKAKMKYENDETLRDLDNDFETLMGWMAPYQPDKLSEAERLRAKIHRKAKAQEAQDTGEVDEYDQLTITLANDIKTRPSDRQKSEEEMAKDRRTELELLEKARRRRMYGEEDDSEDKDDSEEPSSLSTKEKERRKRKMKNANYNNDDTLVTAVGKTKLTSHDHLQKMIDDDNRTGIKLMKEDIIPKRALKRLEDDDDEESMSSEGEEDDMGDLHELDSDMHEDSEDEESDEDDE